MHHIISLSNVFLTSKLKLSAALTALFGEWNDERPEFVNTSCVNKHKTINILLIKLIHTFYFTCVQNDCIYLFIFIRMSYYMLTRRLSLNATTWLHGRIQDSNGIVACYPCVKVILYVSMTNTIWTATMLLRRKKL